MNDQEVTNQSHNETASHPSQNLTNGYVSRNQNQYTKETTSHVCLLQHYFQ